MIVLAHFISVHFSIIIKDIMIKGIKISQSKSICLIFLCTFSTAPYGDTITINTCPCSLLIGSSWPGTVTLIFSTYMPINYYQSYLHQKYFLHSYPPIHIILVSHSLTLTSSHLVFIYLSIHLILCHFG